MIIRPIKLKDKAEYLNMAHVFYKSDAVMQDIPDSYFEATFVELMRSNEFARCYIVEDNGGIAGYGLTARTFSQESGGITVFLEELYIKSEYRSKGYGKKLIEHILHDEPLARRIRLEVEDTNPRAIELYKRLGFEYLEYKQMYMEIE